MEGRVSTTEKSLMKKQNTPVLPHPPFQTASSPPSSSSVYKTLQLRRNRFAKFGGCRSAPLLEKTVSVLKEVHSEMKSQSSMDVLGEIDNSLSEDPILTYIKQSRECLGLDTVPSQHMSDVSTSVTMRESLLVSSAPITGVKDLKVLSRRLSGFDSPTKRDSTVEFVYAVAKENSRGCSVYDLCITEPDRAKAQESYYTVSAFNVSEICREDGMDSISSVRWLWEKEVFSKISALPYFKNFMIRKAFRLWHHWICCKKTTQHLVKLRSGLFTADSQLQMAILKVQSICESASSSSFSHYFESKGVDNTSEIKLISVEEGCTYTLKDFGLLQVVAVSKGQQLLHSLREEIVAVIASACQEVVDWEGIAELCSQTTVEGGIPTHTQVLEWRAILERLERFTRLCGELVVQLLQRLVLKAVSTLLFIMKKLVRYSLAMAATLDEEFGVMRERVASKPFTQGILDRQGISLSEEDQDHVGLVSMQASSFSTLVPSLEAGVGSLSELVETVNSTSSVDEEKSEKDFLSELGQLFKKPEQPVVPLWEVQLTLEDHSTCEVTFSPSIDQFQSMLADLLSKYEHVLKDFKSLSSDDRVLPFVGCSKFDLLKTLEKEEAAKTKLQNEEWIDCQSVLHNYAPYQSIVSQLNKCLVLSMAEVTRKLMHYECYNKMVSVCKSADIASSSSVESWSVPMFQRMFALHHDQVHAMEGMLVSFQVGIMEVRACGYQAACLAHPRQIIILLENTLPKLAYTKCDQLSTRIKEFTELLVTTPTNVTEFIQYLSDVDSATASVPLIEKGMLTATNMYNVAQQFEVEVRVEEIALYKSLFPQFRHLKNVLMQAQATKSETVYQFSTDLRKLVVKVLKQARELRTAIESLVLSEEPVVSPLEALDGYEAQVNALLTQAKQYMDYHHLFGSIPSSTRRFHAVDPSVPSWTPEEVYDEVVSVSQALRARQSLFRVWDDWRDKLAQWRGLPITALSMAELHKDVNTLISQVDYLEKELSLSNKMVSKLQTEVANFRSWLPTLSCLLNPTLKIRHWEMIQKATGDQSMLTKGKSLSIDSLHQIKIFDHHTVIVSVSNEANHEAALESMLKKVSTVWMSRELVLVAHRGVTERPTHVLAGVEDLLASIEDSLLTISTIRSSRYVGSIKHSVVDWQKRLLLMLETVECWVHCQKNWLYLETIFSTVDLQRQLSTEAKLFLQADKSLREVVRVVAVQPTALKAISTPGVLESFQVCSVLLEQVFKSLEDFLETKRAGFPRFYFISNEEVLDILAHTKEPLAIQAYLEKLFTNIKMLDADIVSPVAATVHTVVSNEGERFKLHKSVSARGAPEKWLCSLNTTSCETVRRLFQEGAGSYDEDSRVTWAKSLPGQATQTIALVKWTEQVERCLNSPSPADSLNLLLDTWTHHIADLARVCQTEDAALTRGVLSSLLTQDIHCRDVLKHLAQDQITSTNSFQWIRHLRHYWDSENHCVYLLQLCAQFSYTNEYLGCLPRLVITPLTERCYLTLITALHLNLGGLLLGPAGTGKSETVKDLARTMGRFCLLINCSESLEYKALGQLYSGLCQSGSWCCLDEFNRIRADVLSVLAQQLKCIKEAKERRSVRFVFEGREIKMDRSCGAFVTMNPSYIGRAELPDNVRIYFRPIAMMEPDTVIIAEVLLLSSGFTSAPSLAIKMTKFFEFMESQISRKTCYDFGLRAVKAVVSAARANLLYRRQSEFADSCIEAKSLVSAIVDVNSPKLFTKDYSVMLSLLEDLFGASVSNEANTDQHAIALTDYVKNAVVESSLEISEPQILKCVQLFRCILIHHGVVVMGAPGTGKSTIIKLLRTALNMASSVLQEHVDDSSSAPSIPSKIESARMMCCELETINPKSVSLEELYGFLDKNTLEWKGGMLPKILKQFCSQLAAGQSSDTSIQSHYFSMESLELFGKKVIDESSECVKDSFPLRGDVRESLCFPPVAPAGWRWIVMDGPVDPLWIENLNTALDDSKLLCLSNNERISLYPGVRLLFETDSLENASPATISRCGIILMDDHLLCWQSYTVSWIKQLPKELPEECKVLLKSLFDQSIEKGNGFLKTHKSQLSCLLPAMGAVKTLCYILRALLDTALKECPQLCKSKAQAFSCPIKSEDSSSSIGVQTLAGIYIPTKAAVQDKGSATSLEGHPPQSELLDLVGKLFVFSFLWAFGGCIESAEEDDEGMDGLTQQVTRGGNTLVSKFDALVRKTFSSANSTVYIKLPASADFLFSYFVDIHTSSFVQWKTLVPLPKQVATRVSFLRKGLGNLSSTFSSPFFNDSEFSPSHLTAVSVPQIPTIHTVELAYLAALLADCNVVFVGKSSVGKTQFLDNLIDMLPSSKKRSAVLYSVHRTGTSKGYSVGNKSDQSFTTGARDDLVFKYQLSSFTTSQKLQSVIESHCTRTGLSLLRPAMGNKVIAFLDDLHLPSFDEFGCQQCSELLRQLMDKGGWYDRKNLAWKSVNGVQLVATCGRKPWGPALPSERCLSNFCVFSLPEPSSETLQSVYSAHLSIVMATNKFTDDVVKSVHSVVSCAVFMYQEVASLLTPSPSKPQYTFSIRDLSKVMSRILHINHRNVKIVDDVVQLLSHEFQRVFKDKCFPEDKESILNVLSEGLRIYFKIVIPASKLKEQFLLYEDIASSTGGYTPVKNLKKLVKSLERLQSQYNLTQDKSLQLSFFPQVCEHILRISRVLKQPGGNMILVGEGGLGKRSCTQLAAYIAKCSYCCLTVSEECPGEGLEELRTVLMQCGVNEQPTCLLVAENLSSSQDDVLSIVIELMRRGDMRSLFSEDEVESILSQLSDVLTVEQGSECQLSPRELWETFVKRVVGNLHTVLCLTPSSPILKLLYKKCQSVFTCSTIDVFDEWSPKALFGIAVREMAGCEAAQKLKDVANHLAAAAVKIHGVSLSALSRAHNHSPLSFTITPTTFIKFVRLFCTLISKKEAKVLAQRSHLEAGLSQLRQTNSHVDKLQMELHCLHPEVEAKTKEVETLLCQMTVEQQQLDALRATVSKERAAIAQETEHVHRLKEEAERDLHSVLPALKEAEDGLKTLKKQHFDEIRSYARPPLMVVHVMSAVCLLLGQPTDWKTAKQITCDGTAFLKSLYTYDKENVPDKILSKLRKFTKDENFTPEKVAFYSTACRSFCQWVLAVEKYAEVYRVVQPKHIVYREVRDKLAEVREKLSKKERYLVQLEQQLCELESQHRAKTSERNELQNKYDEISTKMQRAESIINSLTDEQDRWLATLSSLKHQLRTLIGDSLQTAACLTYLGPFTDTLRQALITKWRQLCFENKLPTSEKFKLEESVGDTEQIQHWYVSGLPKDVNSVHSAIIATQAESIPFIVDPQGQASRWLKTLHSTDLKVLHSDSDQLVRDIQDSVIVGTAVLVEGMLDSSCSRLEPFLLKQVYTREGQMFLTINKTEIPYNPSFRLFLICPNPNTVLPSEICNKTTIVNFTCTSESLKEQLLLTTVQLAQPQLDAAYSDLILKVVSDKKELERLESELLDLLRNNKEILEDEEVFTTLQGLKRVATVVRERLESARQTEQEIQSARHQYLPIAVRGSLLYSGLQALHILSHFYQFSMDWFQGIFRDCMEDLTKESCISQEGVAKLSQKVTATVLKEASYCISTEHYTAFAFRICCSISMSEDFDCKISFEEWKAVTKVACILGVTDELDGQADFKPCSHTSSKLKPNMVTQKVWDSVSYLEKHLSCFEGLKNHITMHSQTWEEFMNCSNPITYLEDMTENQTFSPSLLNSFQKLILVQVFCPDKFISEVNSFICKHLGNQYQEKQAVCLSEVIKCTKSKKPILLMLSDGVDPHSLLEGAAQQVAGDMSILVTAYLGSGQEKRVLDLLHFAAAEGKWIVIENCDLVPSWIGKLQKHIKSLNHLHSNFCLFLCCHPNSVLPDSLISLCVKVRLESSDSIKSSMKQLFSTNSWLVTKFEGSGNPPVHWKQLVFNLCLFHSALNARQKFVKISDRVPHLTDLQVSITILAETLGKIDPRLNTWKIVKYLVGDMCYGGSVTNKYDKNMIVRMLQMYTHDWTATPLFIPGIDEVRPSESYLECSKRVDKLPGPDTSGQLIVSQDTWLCLQTQQSHKLQQFLCQLEKNASSKVDDTRNDEQTILTRAAHIIERLVSLKVTRHQGQSSSKLLSLYLDWMYNETLELENSLLLIQESLQEIGSAVRKGGVLGNDQQAIGSCLIRNTVPQFWIFGNQTISVPQWLEYLSSSVNYISRRFSQILPLGDDKLPLNFELSAVASPKALFRFLKQLSSRELKIPLERVQLRVMLASEKSKSVNFKLSGLAIDGGTFCYENGLTTTESAPIDIKELVCCPISEDSCHTKLHQCPIYFSRTRTELVSSVWVPVAEVVNLLQCALGTTYFFISRSTL